MGHLESQEARWVEIFNKFRSIFLVKSFVFKWQLLIDDSFKKGFLGGSVVKNTPANSGNLNAILGSRRSPGEGNGNSLQYSCLGNPMDRGVWWAMVHGVTKESGTTQRRNKFSKKSKIYHLKGTDIKLENTTISPKWDVLKNTLFFTIFA